MDRLEQKASQAQIQLEPSDKTDCLKGGKEKEKQKSACIDGIAQEILVMGASNVAQSLTALIQTKYQLAKF